MALDIKDKLYLDIQFDGRSLALDKLNLIDFLHMSCSTRLAVPMLHLRLKDVSQDSLSKKGLHSGSTITILLRTGYDTKPIEKYVFRLNSWRELRKEGAMLYELDGYLDLPIYWNSSSFKQFTGTSTQTLEAISKACQLKGFKGDACNDSQVWTFDNVTWHEAARRISERGFNSETSCMQLAVELDGTLMYHNVAQMSAASSSFVFPGGSMDGYHPVVSYSPRSVTGSKNNQYGYRRTRIEQDLLNTKVWLIHDKVAFHKSEQGSLQVDNSVRNQLKQNKVDFAPIDVGNVHETYERAVYQNRRVSALFNTGLDLLVPAPTTVKIFDTVSVLFNTTTGSTSANIKQYNGDYLVSSRVVCLQGQEVVEKLELTRRTLNIDIPDSVTGDASSNLSH